MRIAIEGPPGIGKTTLCEMLSSLIPAPFVAEPVEENPYLVDYYKNPQRWAMAMQIDLLYRRVEAANKTKDWAVGLFDRSLWGDRIFGVAVSEMGLMEPREFDTYDRVFRALVERALLPDVIVYLRAPLAVVWKRVLSRARSAEQGMTMEYLGLVHDYYDEFLIRNPPPDVKVVPIEWSCFRPVQDTWDEIRRHLG